MNTRFSSGGRLQASLQSAEEAHGAFMEARLQKATVVAIRYPDEAGNPVKNQTTYDVIFHMPRYRRDNVPFLRTRAGYIDGDEHVLRPSFKTVAASQKYDFRTCNLLGLDGDVVLVDFIDGDERYPVIIGCLPHVYSQAEHVGSKAKGERRFISHKGTSVEIANDGSVMVMAAKDKPLRLTVQGAGDIVLNDGSLLVARKTDPVKAATLMAAWIKKVQACLYGNGPAARDPSLVEPTDFGLIDGGADHVKG